MAAAVLDMFLNDEQFVWPAPEWLTIAITVIVSVLVLWGNFELAQLETPLWQTALAIFVVAWIGQFIGHKIEGRKPSFFKDIQFLLIGPVWLLGFIYRKLGFRY